jgi:hypothetical protein
MTHTARAILHRIIAAALAAQVERKKNPGNG